MNRREFINGTLSTVAALQISAPLMAMFPSKAKMIKVGLITDLHQDVMHNGAERLRKFLSHMKKIKPDLIIQMGDFAYPNDKNRELIKDFNDAHPVALHVIGNHDTDSGHTKEQCIRNWKMPARYYVKEINGVYFIVLDGNDKGSPTHKGGYPAYINDEQKSWLQLQLKEINKPIVILSHQPLAGAGAIDNAQQIQEILSAASDKILLAINGHTHIDCQLFIKGINYVHINSASYYWVGSDYKHNSYPEEIHQAYPWISSTCPYKDALFTTLTIDPATRLVKIDGLKTEWVGPSPAELKFNKDFPLSTGKEIVPCISKRKIR